MSPALWSCSLQGRWNQSSPTLSRQSPDAGPCSEGLSTTPPGSSAHGCCSPQPLARISPSASKHGDGGWQSRAQLHSEKVR